MCEELLILITNFILCVVGPIGLMSMLAARALGASKIAIIGEYKRRYHVLPQCIASSTTF